MVCSVLTNTFFESEVTWNFKLHSLSWSCAKFRSQKTSGQGVFVGFWRRLSTKILKTKNIPGSCFFVFRLPSHRKLTSKAVTEFSASQGPGALELRLNCLILMVFWLVDVGCVCFFVFVCILGDVGVF